ncbi:MAG: arylamine N-acetyltransferase [Leptospirales bacterium]
MSLSERYLNALRIDREASHLRQVHELIGAHQRRFTFNNIDILLEPERLLNLEPEYLFQKIVVEDRGGYCFEHNRLFYAVLRDLGLKVDARLARVLYGKEADVPRTHRVTILRDARAEYLVDVGFGPHTPAGLVPLPGAAGTIPPDIETRGASVRESQDGLLRLTIPKDGEDFTLYSFDRCLYQESDFISANFYTNRHPDSKFVNHLVVSRFTQNGVEYLRDLRYSQIKGDGSREDFPLKSESDFAGLLQKKFRPGLSPTECRKLYEFCKVRERTKTDEKQSGDA